MGSIQRSVDLFDNRFSFTYILLVGIPMTVIAGGLMFMMLSATSDHLLIVFAVFYGFFSGACEFLDDFARKLIAFCSIQS